MDLVLMGMKGSGKTTIKKMVFSKIHPHELVNCEPTTQIEEESIIS